MKVLNGGLENVKGFSFSTIKCGIRYENRLDYALIYSEKPCNAAGVFTTNNITAAPVKICRERINNKIHAILINATNANACTGAEGFDNVIRLTGDLAEKMKIPADSILAASTGIIGRQLPVEKMVSSHSELILNLNSSDGHSMAEAIMTTDTIPKEASAGFEHDGKSYSVAGIAKGSGMISPNMATLLSFILTDAPVAPADMNVIFRKIVKKTFNAITIDGDMSTNDTAIILSPVTGVYLSGESLKEFELSLEYVMNKLAELLIFDGEGATKAVKISVVNASSDRDAELIAAAVSKSLLVKTAFFGNDPNWGRIACAAGYSGAELQEEKLSIYINKKGLFIKGKPSEVDYKELENILKLRNYTITIDAGLGEGEASMLTTDISYDYVKINATYST
ncbi:MAG TPA: bifunctional glutamate N-acetyltransferase/amino-acid acetyltransferase ArgJ [Spirochaetota bacterium]|nr:bifunctional glutamate N-acetyltransferase/amino-acid acetyltransferase ArgJ [Spirochaetota bacterium]